MQRYIVCLFVLLCGGFVEAQSNYRCEYWFDRNRAERVEVNFSGDVGESLLLDVAHLEMGLHTLNVVVGKDSVMSAPRSYTFVKVMDTTGNGGALAYQCWFDEEHSSVHSGHLTNGLLFLPVDSLAVGLHTLNVVVQYGATLSVPRCYPFVKVMDTTDTALTYQ